MTHTSARPKGILYVVATPIGNQADITKRACDTLKAVDCIAAEDTRHSKPLLAALGVDTPLVAYHQHNESKISEKLIERMLKGDTIALISDAGTPLIRDPGYSLVSLAHAHEIQVVPIPGACALIAALSAAGVPTDVFTFAGFLPATTAARKTALKSYATIPHTLVFYESTHRLEASLADIAQILGADRMLVLAKELTKTFETIKQDTVSSIQAWLEADKQRIKGEFVLILPPCVVEEETLAEDVMHCLTTLLDELPVKQAVRIAANITGIRKNILYEAALAYKS